MSLPHRINERNLLIALLAAFALIAGAYSVAVPIFEASDEFWHYPFVWHLANGRSLPVQDPANPGPWKQEASQPPLYYYLGAALTSWVDTGDLDLVRRPNPHVDNGLITADGNINLVVHNAAAEAWPWHGTALAVHLVRFLSVLMSVGSLYLTYRIGLEIFPERRWLALAGAAAVAFTPMFAFISGAVNNDNLAVLLSALGLWLILRIVRAADEGRPTLRLALALGVTLGLGALTKESTLGLFALAGLATFYAAWRRRRWRVFFIEGPLVVGLATAIAEWWYWRNWRLYGDVLGLNAFIAVLGQRARPASLAQLWSEREGFMRSFWGLFGGVNVPMPYWTYDVLNGLAILSLAGLVLYLVHKARRDGAAIAGWMPLALAALWPVLVVISLIRWATVTWSSQGRLVFSAIPSLMLLFVAGLGGWQSERWSKLILGGALGFMAALTVVAPFAWIAPSYRPPPQLDIEAGPNAYDFRPPDGEQPVMRLLAYDAPSPSVHPGGQAELTLYWEALAPMQRDWSTLVHIQDESGIIVAQRDTYPGLGLLAASDIHPGRRWADRYVVNIPATAYAPDEASVLVGLYDMHTGERMLTSGPAPRDSVRLADLLIESDPNAEVPNPVSVNFGGQMELIGYRLDTRHLAPGETLTLDLYWRGLRPMEVNYTVFTHVLGDENRIWAQMDSWPGGGAKPTTAWTPGEIVEDQYRLTLAPDTPPGVYWIEIGVYQQAEDGSLERLQRVEDGHLIEDFLLLTKVRVGQ
jgi:4-amino-4-deoxy-L-arabinose transferase-like glycosyltransferase